MYKFHGIYLDQFRRIRASLCEYSVLVLTEGSGAVLEPSFETVSRDGGVVSARGDTADEID